MHVVLCHELAHIRRHDWLVQIGAETLRAILWFNPLVWMVCARLRRESEQACDDEVLGTSVSADVNMPPTCSSWPGSAAGPAPPWASAMPMAHPSTLERRIAAMLNPRLDRQAPSRPVAGHARRRSFCSSRCRSPPFARARPLRRRYPERSTTPPVRCCRASRWRSWMRTTHRWAATSNGHRPLRASSGRTGQVRARGHAPRLPHASPGVRAARSRATGIAPSRCRSATCARRSRPGDARPAAATAQARSRAESRAIRVGGNIRAPRKELRRPSDLSGGDA